MMRPPGSTVRLRPRLSAATACSPLQKRFTPNFVNFLLLVTLSGRDNAHAKERRQHKHSTHRVSIRRGIDHCLSREFFHQDLQGRKPLGLRAESLSMGETNFSPATAKVTLLHGCRFLFHELVPVYLNL